MKVNSNENIYAARYQFTIHSHSLVVDVEMKSQPFIDIDLSRAKNRRFNIDLIEKTICR